MTTLPGEAIADFVDPILCPNTGTACPAREELVRLHDEKNPKVSFPELGFDGLSDEIKLKTKLGELTFRANRYNCEGAVAGVCPVRERMDNDPVRKVSVNIFRGFRKTIFGKAS